MENSFKSIIDSSKSLLILLPLNPYFDQVAAGLSLFLAIKGQKQAEISCPSAMTVEFNRLVGVNKVGKELGNKNLTLKFVGYRAENIERVSYDIEDGEFRLAIIPKPGSESPKKEVVEFAYSGLAADTIILVGGGSEEHFPALSETGAAEAKIIHLGTKELKTSEERKPLSFARPASSISEIVASLLKEGGYEFDQDISTNLLMGVEEGSANLTNDQVRAETFELMAFLLRQGGQRKPRERVPLEVSPLPKAPGDIQTKVPRDWRGPKVYKGTTLS